MASTPYPQEDKSYLTDAYFEIILNRDSYDEIPDRALENPKIVWMSQFWVFLESRKSETDREEWADGMLRFKMAEVAGKIVETYVDKEAHEKENGMLRESEETREIDIKSILEGGMFQFLRGVYCKLEEGFERDIVTARVSEDRGQESRQPSVSTTEAGPRRLVRYSLRNARIWEWTGYDSEAEKWWSEGGKNRVRAADGSMRILPREDDKTWEWTRYDSKAEVEEAIREYLRGTRSSGTQLP